MLSTFLLQGPQPNPWAKDQYQSVTCQGLHSRVGGAWRASEASSRSPLLALPPELYPQPRPSSVEKLSFMKPLSGAKNVGDCCFNVPVEHLYVFGKMSIQSLCSFQKSDCFLTIELYEFLYILDIDSSDR